MVFHYSQLRQVKRPTRRSTLIGRNKRRPVDHSRRFFRSTWYLRIRIMHQAINLVFFTHSLSSLSIGHDMKSRSNVCRASHAIARVSRAWQRAPLQITLFICLSRVHPRRSNMINIQSLPMRTIQLLENGPYSEIASVPMPLARSLNQLILALCAYRGAIDAMAYICINSILLQRQRALHQKGRLLILYDFSFKSRVFPSARSIQHYFSPCLQTVFMPPIPPRATPVRTQVYWQ